MKGAEKPKRKMKISFDEVPKPGFSFTYSHEERDIKLSFVAHRTYKPYGEIANVCLWVDEDGNYWSSGMRSNKAHPCSDEKAKWIIEKEDRERPASSAPYPSYEIIEAEGREAVKLINAFMNGRFRGMSCLSLSSTRSEDGVVKAKLRVAKGEQNATKI